MESLGQIGEHEAISRILQHLGNHQNLVVGAGDDCAVCRLPGMQIDQVLTTDPVIENVHFLASDDPKEIGNKAVGRVLSDIAAMGARPQWILVNVVAPREFGFPVLENIYAGMNALCNRFGATIIGGDLSMGSALELHVFGTGTVPAGTALLRSGAKPGDRICVTGSLGGSREGRHLNFVPRVEEGIFLRESGIVHSMMDISDGLATDLRHILKQSGVGAEMEAEAIPTNGTLQQALYEGEDFELLFTVPANRIDFLRQEWTSRFGAGLFCIGRITEASGVLEIVDSDGQHQVLESKAYEHFSL